MTILSALKAGFIGGCLSAGINAVVYYIVGSVFGFIPQDVLTAQGQPITIGPVIGASIIPSILGALLCWVFIRALKTRGMNIFTVVAIVLCIASFANPYIAIVNVPAAMAWTLNAMHVIVAAALLWELRKAYTLIPIE